MIFLPDNLTEQEQLQVVQILDGPLSPENASGEIAQIVGGGESAYVEFVVLSRSGVVDIDPSAQYPIEPRAERPTGQEMFEAKSRQEQDEMLGPEAAELVRSGQITLEDLKGISQNESIPNFLTQRPVSDAT